MLLARRLVRTAGTVKRPALSLTGTVRRITNNHDSTTPDGWRPHLDWGWLKANVSVLDAAISARNMPNLIGLPLKVAKLHDEWLATGKAVEQAEKEHATNGRAIHTSKDESKKDELMARANATKANLHAAQTRSDAVWKALNSEAERLPNLVSPETPIGDESKAKLLGTGGVKPVFTFPVRDHMSIGTAPTTQWFGLLDAIAGPRFLTLQNEASLLELALIQFTVDRLINRYRFNLVTPPDLVKAHFITAAGFQPRTTENTQVYHIQNPNQSHSHDLALTGTAEVPLAAALADRSFTPDELPFKLAAFGHCFRTEVGAGGTEGRGIYRLHQFSKVEMFAVSDPAHSDSVLNELIGVQRSVLDELELHYRVLEMPSAELGAPAFRKVDIECYIPSRDQHQHITTASSASSASYSSTAAAGAGGAGAATTAPPIFGEISSASNCTDYQARRLNIKIKQPKPSKAKKDKSTASAASGDAAKPAPPSPPLPAAPHGKQFVHTLNATACAVPRLILAICEQHQRADGTVHIPNALRPFIGGHKSMPFLPSRARLL